MPEGERLDSGWDLITTAATYQSHEVGTVGQRCDVHWVQGQMASARTEWDREASTRMRGMGSKGMKSRYVLANRRGAICLFRVCILNSFFFLF